MKTCKDCLYLLQQFVKSNKVDLTPDLITVFEGHLTQFSDCFKKFFPEDLDKFARIRFQFTAKVSSEFTSTEKENLTELSCDKNLKQNPCSMKETEVWISVKGEYPLLSAKAQQIPIQF